MKRNIILCAALIIFVLVFVQFSSGAGKQKKPSPKEEMPSISLKAETLTFDISWKFIDAGSAVVKVIPLGANVKITADVSSNKTISAFYPVRDIAETLIYKGYLQSYRLRQSEGRSKRDREVILDWKGKNLKFVNHLTGTNEKIELPKMPVWDLLSCLYFLRSQRLEVGNYFTLNLVDTKRLYGVDFRVLKKERIKHKQLGNVEAILIKPHLSADTQKKYKQKGDIDIWLSNDERKLPLKIEAKVLVGSITLTLVSVQ